MVNVPRSVVEPMHPLFELGFNVLFRVVKRATEDLAVIAGSFANALNSMNL